jgi:enolase
MVEDTLEITFFFQELMVAPTAAQCIIESIQWDSEVYQSLKALIKDRFGSADCLFLF